MSGCLQFQLTEIREKFVPGRPLRQCRLNWPHDALKIDWVKAKGGFDLIQVPGEGRWKIYQRSGWIIAEVVEVR